MARFLRRLSLPHAVAGGVMSAVSASGVAHALRIEEDTKLDFKDVLLRPKRSELSSRAQAHRSCARAHTPWLPSGYTRDSLSLRAPTRERL